MWTGAWQMTYEELMEAYGPELRRIARGLTYVCDIDPALSREDLEQEALLVLLTCRERFEAAAEIGDLGGYLHNAIVHRAWKIAGYKEARRGFASPNAYALSLDQPMQDSESGDLTIMDTLAAESPDPADVAQARDTRRRIAHALKQLPDAQRAVILLKYYGGLIPERIARILGTGADCVRELEGVALRTLAKDEQMRQLWDFTTRRRRARRKLYYT